MITWTTNKGWRAVAVSEIGAAHVETDMPCQDASRLFIDSDTLIACAADGAGSARLSHRGAQTAADEFVVSAWDSLCEGRDLSEAVLKALDSSRKAVAKIANGNPRRYATTLLGLVATSDKLAAVQIGDGAIIVDGEVAMDSHSGEYANETSFITQPDAEPMTFSLSQEVRRVAILTDGLENLALENNGYQKTPHRRFFDPLYQWLEQTEERDRSAQLGEFLVSDRVRSRTTDDVTLLLAMR